MKNYYTFILGALLAVNTLAQSYSENFDSFNTGDYIGVVGAQDGWTTWNGSTGGSSDAKITDVKANSGANALYFSSTSASGGPQDVILDFGGPYSTGKLIFEQSIFVETGKGGYFNFQENTAPGTYLINCFMVDDGAMLFSDAAEFKLETTYPINEWFTYRLEIDIVGNRFEFYINDVLKGAWDQQVSKVASIDIFPRNPEEMGGNSISGFYIDDVSYTYDISASTVELTDNESFKLFPNPTNAVTYFSIENSQNITPTVVIYDKSGKLIATINNVEKNGVEINTEGFVPGVYIVKVKVGNKISSRKLIVQ